MMNLIILWNIIVFVLYGYDKRSAIRGAWRISEKVLILSAFLIGGFGAFLGMQVFRHKTKKLKFNVLVPLAMFLNLAAIYYFGRVSV